MLTRKNKRMESVTNRFSRMRDLSRFFKYVRPIDIADASEPEEGEERVEDVELAETEPVITDLVSGKRVVGRRVSVGYTRAVRIGGVVLVLGVLISGLILWPAWQSRSISQFNLRVLFSVSHTSNLALAAWSDDEVTEEIYSVFGTPAYFGVACYKKTGIQGVCGDQHLSFVDGSGNLYTWNKSTGKVSHSIAVKPVSGNAVEDWSWLYPGQYIMVHARGANGSTVYQIWDVLHSRLLATTTTSLVGLTSDGRWVATYIGAQKIEITDTYHNQPPHFLTSPFFSHLVALSWSPDTNELATASSDGTIQVWNVFGGQLVKTWSALEGKFVSKQQLSSLVLSWSPSDLELAISAAVSGEAPTVRIWEVASGQLNLEHAGLKAPPSSISWLDAGQELLVSNVQESQLWSVSSGQTLLQFNAQQIMMQSGYYVSQQILDEPLIAIPEGTNIQVVDMRTGLTLQMLPNGENNTSFLAAAWKPGMQTSPAAIDKSGDLLIWDMHPWQIVAHYQLPCALSAREASLTWSPDGQMLEVNCGDGSLVILGIAP